MNNKLKYILLAAFAATSVSCSDFLTEEPATSILDKTLFSSELGLEANVTGIYEAMDEFLCGGNFYYYFCNGSLYRDWSGNRTATNWIQSHYMTMFSKTSSNEGCYKSLYTGINRCNTTIDGALNCDVDEGYRRQIVAECRFLRAVFYFYGVRMYGDLPLVDFNPKEMEDLFIPRTSYRKIYKFIVDDLTYAEQNMRTKEEQESTNPGKSRCYNFAATAFKSLVYAQIACYMESPFDQFFDATKKGRYPDFSACGFDTAKEAWAASLEAAEKVINDPQSPYGLESDYRHLFRWDPVHFPEDYMSKERILTMQHSPTMGVNTMATWSLWKRPYGTLAKNGTGDNAGRVRPNRIVWEYWNRFYGGGYAATTDKVYTIPTTDPRLAATYEHSQVKNYSDAYDGAYTISTVFPLSTGAVTNSHYFRKFLSPAYNIDAGNADYYALRMADIYLSAAEAASALGEFQKAVDYVNVLHRRARASVDRNALQPDEPHDLTAGEFATRAELDSRLMWEREFEFHGEEREWFMSHRRGARWMIKYFITPFNEFMQRSDNASVRSYMWQYGRPAPDGSTAYDIPSDMETVRKCLICAYPDYELRYNTALTAADQNDFFIE